MTKEKDVIFYVEGSNWTKEVTIDLNVCTDERSQLIEAGTKAIELKLEGDSGSLDVGPILLVRKGSNDAREAMVNTYLCLINAAQYKIAEDLRENYKKASNGKDLALDNTGYTY